MKKNYSLTEGNITKALWHFTIPLILTGLLQQLYSITDAMILGNFIGGSAVASVGAASTIINIAVFVTLGVMTGFSIHLSHLVGAKEYDKIQRLSTTCVIILSIITSFSTLLILLFKDYAFAIMNTPDEILQMSTTYLVTASYGFIFMLLYALYSAMIRAVGDSKTPLIALVISSLLNIILDLIFVAVFNWGIGGACFATVLAQGISAFYMIYHVNKHIPYFKIVFKKSYLDFVLFKECVVLSMPKILQSLAMSVGNMFLQSILNYFGVDTIAAITTAYRIDALSITPIMYISSAVSIFTGQNLGAHQPERAKEGLKKSCIMAVSLSLCVTATFVSLGGLLLSFFGLNDNSIVIGWRFFRICAIFYPIMSVFYCLSGYLQGSKDVQFVAVTSVLSLVVRILVSYVFRDILHSDVIAIAECVSWVTNFILCYIRYKSIAKRQII